MVFALHGSTSEAQIKVLFGVSDTVEESFSPVPVSSTELILPVRLLLEEIGIEVDTPTDSDDEYLQMMMKAYKGRFPTTKVFSKFARKLSAEKDPCGNPDQTLCDWMDFEERLFRIYERAIVEERLALGFGASGNDVDEFIAFSLSVQNRRKCRVGHALENHIEELFSLNRLLFERGSITENKSKPDFLFPGQVQYRDPVFNVGALRMLGSKMTCKDRWRQVLAEAERIDRKHLITFEAAISNDQTEEMRGRNLQLVVPSPIHTTYNPDQRAWLYSVADFIAEVRALQS